MLLIIIVKLIVLPNFLVETETFFFRIFDENVFCLIILNIYCNFWSV